MQRLNENQRLSAVELFKAEMARNVIARQFIVYRTIEMFSITREHFASTPFMTFPSSRRFAKITI